MKKTTLDALMKKYTILPFELDDIFDFVGDLLYEEAKELEQTEPTAFNTIKRLKDASYEVFELSQTIAEMESEV